MKPRPWIALATLLTLGSALGAQESREAFPLELLRRRIEIARELPVVFRLEPGVEERAWLPLDAAPPATEERVENQPVLPPAPEPGVLERWMLVATKARFPGITAAETVDRSTVRHDGVQRTVTGERGVEVRGPRPVVAEVRRFFDRFAAGSKKVVTLELHVLETAEPDAPGDARSEAAVASRQDFERRVRELTERREMRGLIHSPVVKVFANHTAKLSVVEQVSYVKDYKVEVLPGGKIADPLLAVIDEGFELELTPIYDPDGGALIVGGRIGFSRLARPIPEHRLKIGDAEVTVQLPSVRSNRWSGEIRLEPGQNTFKITGLKDGPRSAGQFQNVEVWCLVTVSDGETGRPGGEIVDRDDQGAIFVTFPGDYVPDDPWSKAPKEVAVYRGQEKIGSARLAGGWVMAADAKRPVVVIYQLAEGTPRDGDSVR
jgi:hypothetical protein